MESEAIRYIVHRFKSLNDIENSGLREEYFVISPEHRQIFNYIIMYSKKHNGIIPSINHLKKKFPNFNWEENISEELVDILRELKENYLRSKILTILESKKDLNEKLEMINYFLVNFSSDNPSNPINFESTVQSLISEFYEQVKNKSGLLGYYWPWNIMNNSTNGIVPGYYLVYGLTKTMKTWFTLYIIAHLYKISKANILIYSAEMSPTDIIRRLALLLAEIDERKFIKGQLDPKEEKRLFDFLKTVENNNRITVLPPSQDITYSYLVGLSQKLNYEVLFVDSIYLLASKKRGNVYSNIVKLSNELLQISHEYKKILFVSTQEHERTAKVLGSSGTASVGYAHRLVEDADLAFHLFKYSDPQTGLPELGIEFPATRNFEIKSFTINAIPAYNFEFKFLGLRRDHKEQKTEAKFKTLESIFGVSLPDNYGDEYEFDS
jgi:replicative DNA helicase